VEEAHARFGTLDGDASLEDVFFRAIEESPS